MGTDALGKSCRASSSPALEDWAASGSEQRPLCSQHSVGTPSGAAPHTCMHRGASTWGARGRGSVKCETCTKGENVSSIKCQLRIKNTTTHIELMMIFLRIIFQAQTYNRLRTVCRGAFLPLPNASVKKIWAAHESNSHNQKIKGPGKVN